MPVSAAPGRSAEHLHAQRAGRVVGRSERERLRNAAGDDGDRPLLERLREAFDELGAAAEIDAVGEPDEFHIVRVGEEARDRRQRLGAVDRVRRRLDLVQAHARRTRRRERNIAGAFGERDQRDRAMIAFGPRDDVVSGAKPRVPGSGRRPAVVDQDRDRRARLHRRQRRIPQRTGRGDNDQRRKRKPHESEPPRRARRRFLLGRDLQEQPGRREVDAARARRDQPQQPPQYRQGEQPDQHQRFGKTERQSADHADTLGSAMPASAFRRRPGRRRCGHAAPAAVRSPADRCDGW